MSHDCPTCGGRCRMYPGTYAPTVEDLREDLVLAQERWHKARREGQYFRAERWAKSRDLALDHLYTPADVRPRYQDRNARLSAEGNLRE